jgi:hypothetical protein
VYFRLFTISSALSLLLLVVSGCSVNKPIPDNHTDAMKSVLILHEMLYENGWKEVGRITVSQNGNYAYSTRDHAVIKKGTLPSELLSAIEHDIGEGRIHTLDGVGDYQVGVDDLRTKHPASIEQLLVVSGLR